MKAFCCGKCDECIGKAKLLQLILIRKQLSNAQREDALLHALDIETACESISLDFCSDNSEAEKNMELGKGTTCLV